MKKWVVLLIVLSLAASVYAGLDVSFSSNNGGYWSYTAETEGIGTFSFVQPVGVDNVQGLDSSSLSKDRVYIPNLIVSDIVPIALDWGTIYKGIVTPESTAIEIKKGSIKSDTSLSGDLGTGTIVIVGTTALLYPIFQEDIANTEWMGSILAMDFDLTLQGGNIAAMIQNGDNNKVGGTFSGSMTVPEPATFFILAFGSVLFWRKEKTA